MSQSLNLKFITDVQDLDYAVVEFKGEIDRATIHSAENQIEKFLANFKRRAVVFDLKELHFINSDGIGFFVSTQLKLAKKGQELILCGVIEHVADIIELVGLAKMLPVFSNMQDVIKHIKHQPAAKK